jgi:DNA-binding NarL/FixJ family response regulator
MFLSRVIIADDHPLFRSALARLLEEGSGLEEGSSLEVVAQVSDGQEALELSRRLRPEVVLMDVIMPKMDGIAATRAIKAELPRTIVLVMTASDDLDHLAEALRAGAAGYVLKTSSFREITDAISKVLEGESPLDSGVAKRLLVRLLEQSQQKRPQGKLEEESGAISSQDSPPRRTHSPLPAGARSLSSRELEVLRLIAQGETNQRIAGELLLSTSTVKKHVHRVISKLGVSDRTQAAIMAIELGLLSNVS